METIKKWNVFFVLAASLVLTVSVGGIGPSPALACDCGYGCDHEKGWMTGGGSIFAVDDSVTYGGSFAGDGRVTHGFVVHCTPRHSDNLQIVDHAINQGFHLTELIYAECTDDPTIEPNPPNAASIFLWVMASVAASSPFGIARFGLDYRWRERELHASLKSRWDSDGIVFTVFGVVIGITIA
jgi:hypothetical protein